MIKIKTITTALLAMALATACTPQAEELAATTQPVTLMPTATIVSNGTAAVTRATTNEVGITLSDGTLNLTMDGVEKEYTVGTGGALTTTTPHKATVGKHAFAVAEAKVTATIEHENKPLPMNLNVAMTKQDLTVAAGGAVALPLAPTTAGMRLVLNMDADVVPTSVTYVPSGEVAPIQNTLDPAPINTASRIVPLSVNQPTGSTHAVAFGMLPAGTTIKGAHLATIEILDKSSGSGGSGGGIPKTLSLLAPAPLTLAAGEMVTYTVHVDHSLATITGVTIGGFTEGNGTGEDIGVGIAMADGTSTLDPKLFNEKNPVWNITGDGANDAADKAILTNVKKALTALNNTSARIHVILPDFTGTFVNDAFKNCATLTSISAPKATSIGSGAFYGCKALTSISLPAATTIGYQAFEVCTALATISLPVATDIGNYAFKSCTKLATISLPAATSIMRNAFDGCSALIRLELTGTKKITMSSFAFLNTPDNITLVLNSKATNATIGVTVEDAADGKKNVTFSNTDDGGMDDVTATFKAVEYIN